MRCRSSPAGSAARSVAHVWPATFVAVLALVAVPTHASAQSAADLDAARELFRDGTTAASSGDWKAARAKLERSLALKRSPLTLHELAVAQRESGALAAALASFREFVASPQSVRSQPLVAAARSEVARLEARVGRVTVHVSPNAPGVDVQIDGVRGPATPREPRYVDPGRRTIRVEAPGYRVFQDEIDVAGGEAAIVHVTMLPEAHPPSDGDTAPRHDEPSTGSALPFALLIGGGVLASAGVGVGIAGLATGDGAVEGTAEAEQARTMGIVADVAIGSGIGAAGLGLVLHLLSAPDESTNARVTPWAAGSRGGVRVRF